MDKTMKLRNVFLIVFMLITFAIIGTAAVVYDFPVNSITGNPDMVLSITNQRANFTFKLTNTGTCYNGCANSSITFNGSSLVIKVN